MWNYSFNIREFIWWLSLFLYGMFLFQYSIKKIGTRYLKNFLRHWTNTPLKWILTGTFATAILQSSSVVSLIVLWFVGTWVLTFENSIWVVIWSNIWATITAWLIWILWFSLDLEAIALPIIWITGILMMSFSQKRKLYLSLLFLFWFWLLLFWLNFMKWSLMFWNVDLSIFTGFPIVVFVLVWIILTALVQSTAVCNAIVFTALYSWIINFEIAAMIIIWSNIWTSITAILGSLWWTHKQKQVTLVQILYNIFTASIILIFFRPLSSFIQNWLNLTWIIWLAIFHTIFNVSWALIHFPFIKKLIWLVEKILPEKHQAFHLNIMDLVEKNWSTAILAIKNDIQDLYNKVTNFNLTSFHVKRWMIWKENTDKILKEDYFIKKKTYEDNFNTIKKIESYILNFTFQFDDQTQEKHESESVQLLNKSLINFVQSAKMLKDIKKDIEDFKFNDKKILQEEFLHFKEKIINFYWNIKLILDSKKNEITKIKKLKQKVNEEEKDSLDRISKKFQERSVWWNIKSAFFSKNIEEEEFSELIMINNYLYNSQKEFLEWMKHFFLSSFEKTEKNTQENKKTKEENQEEIFEENLK